MSRALATSSSTHTSTAGDTSMSRPLVAHGGEQLLAAVGVEEERDPAVGDLARSAPRPWGRSRPGRSGCRRAAGGSASSAACPGRCPRPAAGTPCPRTPARPRGRAPRARSPRTRACATSGRANETPCQPSDTCGPDTPRPSRKRPSGQRVERGRGHGGHRRRAGGDLEQSRAEPDPLGHGAHVPEHGGGVLAPGLGTHTESRPSRSAGLRQLDLLLRGVPGPVGEEEADAHAAILCAVRARIAAVAVLAGLAAAPARARVDARHGVGPRLCEAACGRRLVRRADRAAASTATAAARVRSASVVKAMLMVAYLNHRRVRWRPLRARPRAAVADDPPLEQRRRHACPQLRRQHGARPAGAAGRACAGSAPRPAGGRARSTPPTRRGSS